MNKKLKVVLCFSLFFVATFLCFGQKVVMAADATASPAAYKTSVSRISLSKTIYSQGEIVNGTFNLVNSGQGDVSDLYYRVLVVGGFDKDGMPEYVYGQSDLKGPLYVGGKNTVSVPFSYVLPPYVGGKDVGIKIELLTKQGRLLYLNFARFDVEGSMSAINIQGASIKIGNQTFDPQSGPTIHEGENPSVIIGLFNPMTKSVTIASRISVYDKAISGIPLFTETSTTTFTISAKTEKTVSYKLPIFDNKPGVYVGVIDFVDAAGVVRSSATEFRYIIGGDIATIQSVDVGSSSIEKGQIVDVSVLYSGSPIDTRDYDKVDGVSVGESKLSVSLFNEKNEFVGKAESLVDVRDVQTAIVKVLSLVDAAALRADVVLSKGDKVLSKLSTSLVPSPESLSKKTASNAVGHRGLISLQIILVIIGILISGVVLWFILKKNKSVPTLVILFISIALAGLSLYFITNVLSGYARTQTADAATYIIPTGYVGSGGWIPTYWFGGTIRGKVLLPLDNINLSLTPSATDLKPGEQFSITATITALQCSNADQYVSLYIQSVSWLPSFVPVKYSKNNHKAPCGGECFRYTNTSFFAGTYTAPTTPGDYRITFKVTDNWPGSTPKPARLEGYITVTVSGEAGINPEPTCVCQEGSPNCSDCSRCDDGYILNIPTGLCVLPGPSQFYCGTSPMNSTLCLGDNLGLTENTISTTVNQGQCSTPVGSEPKCQFACNVNYVKGSTGRTCVKAVPCELPSIRVNGVCVTPPTVGVCNPFTEDSDSYVAKFANVGQLVTWQASSTGAWSETADGPVLSTGDSYQVRYSTIGKKTMYFKVDNGAIAPCTTEANELPDGLPIVNAPGYQPF